MKRHLVLLTALVLVVPLRGMAQETPSLATPSGSGAIQETKRARTRVDPHADILLTPDERRDLEAFLFWAATCTEEGMCLTLSALKNVPDGNIVLFDEEYEGHKTRKQVWPGNTSGKWRAFLDGAGIPDPPDNIVLNRTIVLIGVDGTDGLIGVDVTATPSDPTHPFITITFNRNMYVREIMKNFSLASLRGEDFLDRWRAITRDPQWKTRRVVCTTLRGAAEKECEQNERARMELLGRLVLTPAIDQRLQIMLYGTHSGSGPFFEAYYRCATRGTMPEDLAIEASIGNAPLDNLRAQLIAGGIASETAEQWAQFAERTASDRKAEIERQTEYRVQRGVAEEEARDRATKEVVRNMRRDLKPLAEDPAIGACASLLWDVEQKFYTTLLGTLEALARNESPRELPIILRNLEPYLKKERGNVRKAIRNYLRDKLKTWHEPWAGPKVALYDEHWRDHK